MTQLRDIDYAAAAVQRAVFEKFSSVDLKNFQVMAGDRTIYIEHDGRNAESIRGVLLDDVRKATSYDDFWDILANDERITRMVTADND